MGNSRINIFVCLVLTLSSISCIGQIVELIPTNTTSGGANWSVNGAATHIECIDEGTPGNGPTDYISTSSSGVNYECLVESIDDPADHTNHKVLIELWANNGATNFTIGLYQGATQIAQWVQAHSTGWTNYALSVSTIEAANITDYSDLRIRVQHSSSGTLKAVSQISLEVPRPNLTIMGAKCSTFCGASYETINGITRQ